MLSREEVLKIARLARLELTENEVGLYQQRLSRVLEYMRDLEKVSTQKDQVVRHVPKDAVAFREDKVVAFPNVKGLLDNAPEREGTSFHLPPVMED